VTLRRLAARAVLLAGCLALLPLVSVDDAAADTVRPIHFPVEGAVRFRDDWGDPRGGGTRQHRGNDLAGRKLQPLLAAADGVVARTGVDDGISGNYLVIRDAAGWEYLYIHVNNDTPGTDDGANPPAWRFAPGIGRGARVRAGQHVGWMGDSGNAEDTQPHLHFEIHRPGVGAINPYRSLLAARNVPVGTFCDVDRNPPRRPDPASAAGWWQAGADGGIFTFGDVPFAGATRATTVALAARDRRGYWSVTPAGLVHAHGAPHHGDLAAIRPAAPVVDLAAHPSGDGYWVLGGDGGVFTFGSARFHGSTGAMRLNRPVVGMAATPSGGGYWLVASDGGVFTFGDARFHGSTGAMRLNEPVTAMAPTPSGRGYWLLGRDGGLFAFGDAGFHGSVPGTGSCGPLRAVAIVATPSGLGYWIQSSDGRVWPFGDATGHGDVFQQRMPGVTIVDLAVATGDTQGP
jgi:hypothetical protein